MQNPPSSLHTPRDDRKSANIDHNDNLPSWDEHEAKKPRLDDDFGTEHVSHLPTYLNIQSPSALPCPI